ncbi:DNA internalization-related competence protein ComEC/Rec2 [Cohnella luojiensis]|uniref:DNA internalization-related competence protein ComEC/Rec2 n=1 Tax=Cohnella luojiensis TaxID=652876 RepID=A0A4Y8M6L2_9BACL|nr:DNA internalization-related competence protein ComEC/Rec2 [Cohnella luojiensis]TFE31636.1 DNA internalization-related competence protein ComEC/Rec2 [Cohnella luojiensis]
MNERPLVVIACCWITGISIGSLCQGMAAHAVLLSILILLSGFSLLGKLTLKLTVLCGIALLLSYGERLWVEQRNISDIEASAATIGAEVELSGHIASIVEVDGDLATFRLKTEAVKLALASNKETIKDIVIVRIKLSRQTDQAIAAGWQRGDSLGINGVIELPGDAGNFGAFDYRGYLMRQGIHWQLAAKGIDSVTLTGETVPIGKKPLRAFDQLRSEIGRLMDRLYPHDDAGYMKGLVVGIRSDLDPEQYDNFARLGLTHVLAISGLHVAVVVYLLLQIGAWTRLTRERTIDVTIAMMPIYMLVTGASPSAVRACLMAMIALWLARRHALKDGLHLLLAAAMLMLLFNPVLIEDVSFQLSFLVTAGLILFVPTVTASLPIPWKWLRGPVAVALTAQAVSFPVTIYYFHAVHLLSLPANFVLVPFISFIVMPLGMASIALGAIWLPMGIIPAKLATISNQLTFGVVDWLNGFIELRTVWPQPSLLWVASAYVLMSVGIVGLKRRLARKEELEWWVKQANEGEMQEITAPLIRTYSGSRDKKYRSVILRSMFFLLGSGWFSWGYQPAWLDRHATVQFISVGQGDSILIRTGRGKHILIDSGGTLNFRKPGEEWRMRRDPYEVGRKLLVPLLLTRGIRELDALVLTHFDMDHIGGAQAVLSNIPVRKLIFNGSIKDSPEAINLLRSAIDKGIPCYALHTSMEWAVDNTTIVQALFPDQEGTKTGNEVEVRNEQNNLSIVLLVSVYGRSFLLPGDLEEEGEREVVKADQGTGNVVRRVDVLKAGHHGSKTSTTSEWVNHWQPRETVVSAGLNNMYGHPHETVLERLADAGSLVWRTDLNGEIQYRVNTDGSMERRMVHVKK